MSDRHHIAKHLALSASCDEKYVHRQIKCMKCSSSLFKSPMMYFSQHLRIRLELYLQVIKLTFKKLQLVYHPFVGNTFSASSSPISSI